MKSRPQGRTPSPPRPRGYYELDPGRMYARYHSHAWDQSMPYAMFFNWEHQGEQTGLAIHAASGERYRQAGQPRQRRLRPSLAGACARCSTI